MLHLLMKPCGMNPAAPHLAGDWALTLTLSRHRGRRRSRESSPSLPPATDSHFSHLVDTNPRDCHNSHMAGRLQAFFGDDLLEAFDSVKSAPGAFGNIVVATARQVRPVDAVAFGLVLLGWSWLAVGAFFLGN